MSILIYLLLCTHLTILCVTLYLHRSQAHRGVEFNPVISHFMRFWLWLTTGMITQQWVAIHRKHHRFCEQPDDPHSPKQVGLWRVLFGGALLYHAASKDTEMVRIYGVGTPDDWIERRLYTPHSRLGIGILFLFNIALFGWMGAIIWGIQMLWIPFWAAGVINGLAHWWGYRNGETRDSSRNIFPLGIWIGGEELHNNHHLSPGNPRLSMKWWEFDIGYAWIQILCFLKLAQLRTTTEA
jgi:stearoyl-CoA desaturase (delta-9 desaturase)